MSDIYLPGPAGGGASSASGGASASGAASSSVFGNGFGGVQGKLYDSGEEASDEWESDDAADGAAGEAKEDEEEASSVEDEDEEDQHDPLLDDENAEELEEESEPLEPKAKRVKKSAEQKAAETAAREAKKYERERVKEALQERKLAKELTKPLGDAVKAKLKGKKSRVNGYKVELANISWEKFSAAFGPYQAKFNKFEAGKDCKTTLTEGEVADVLGKTKVKGGSMYQQFCVSEATVTRKKDGLLTFSYKTAETF